MKLILKFLIILCLIYFILPHHNTLPIWRMYHRMLSGVYDAVLQHLQICNLVFSISELQIRMCSKRNYNRVYKLYAVNSAQHSLLIFLHIFRRTGDCFVLAMTEPGNSDECISIHNSLYATSQVSPLFNKSCTDLILLFSEISCC